MKKLFVLFLLVALVPFTVGCSLWGHDEDLDVLPVTITAKAVVPAAGLSALRAAAVSVVGTAYENYTLTVGTQVLNAYMYETVGTNVEITFRAEVTSAQKAAFEAQTGVVNVTLSDGVKTETASVNMTTAGTITVTVTVDAVTGNTEISGVAVNGTAVADENIATGGTYSITSVTVGGNTLGSTAATYATATVLFPAFTVTFPDAVTAADVTVANGLSITTKNAAGVTVAIAADDFTVAQGTANTIIVTVKDQAEPKRLNNGTVYSVTINSLKNADKLLAAAQTFWFKVVL